MRWFLDKFVLAGGALVLLSIGLQADVIPTNEWVNFKGSVTYNGSPAPVGAVVDAYDPTGVHCGTFTVGVDNENFPDSTGIYGFMPVYADDKGPGSTVDEGAESGDVISFRIMNRPATIDSGDSIWTAHGEIVTADLSGSGTIALELADPPADSIGESQETVRFLVGVRNLGNGNDFYGVSTNSALGWQTIDYDTLLYRGTDSAHRVYPINEPESTMYVFFDVVIPVWPGYDPDTIVYEVFSYLDPSVKVTDTVTLLASPVDVGDDPHGLPERFSLFQNYPNPFNPTTTISFDLPVKSAVVLTIYDILGRQADRLDLGTLSAGLHDIEYEAWSLPSGVYLYQLTTDFVRKSRKMILTK